MVLHLLLQYRNNLVGLLFGIKTIKSINKYLSLYNMKGSGIGQMKHSMNNLFLESATMPPNVKDILNRRGDAIVNSIKIGRTPVQSALQGILKTLSTVPYDQLFHLFMIFKTTKGDILFEKNARINASTTIPKSEDWYEYTNC